MSRQLMKHSECMPGTKHWRVDYSAQFIVDDDLTGCSFYDCDFTGASFANSNLEGVTLFRSKIEDCEFEKTNIYGIRTLSLLGTPKTLPNGWIFAKGFLIGPGVTLRHVNFRDVDFSGVNLHEADLSFAMLEGALFEHTALNGLVADGLKGSPSSMPKGWKVVGGTFVGPGCDLTVKDLRGCDLRGVNLEHAMLAETQLTDVSSGEIVGQPNSLPDGWKLKYGYLLGPGAWLAGEVFSGLDARQLNLSGANLQDISIQRSDLRGTNLTSALLQNAKIYESNVDDTDFTDCNLNGLATRLLEGTPSGLPNGWILCSGYMVGPTANLDSADLKGCNLQNQDLSWARLSGACLCGSNLDGADLSNAYLEAACFDTTNLTRTRLNDAHVNEAIFGSATIIPSSDSYRKIPITGVPKSIPKNCEFSKGYLLVFPPSRTRKNSN